MASNIQQLRSGTSSKRPIPSSLANGQLAVQYHQSDPAIYIKDASGDLVKIAPAFIGASRSSRLLEQVLQGRLDRSPASKAMQLVKFG